MKKFSIKFFKIIAGTIILLILSLLIYTIYDKIHYQIKRTEFIEKQSKLDYKIGVLSIALGRYNVLWKEFYESSEKYFFPGVDKQYFLFTDDLNIPYKDKPNVKVIYTKNVKWPYHALLRYDIFLSQKKELSKLDYLYYFNMDYEFKNFVGEEVLPQKNNDGLVFVTHCLYYNKPPKSFPYERNPKSVAYIPYGKEGKYYVPGGINGGASKEFLEYCEYCSKNAHIDIDNKVVPHWHDEAYTNKYIIDKNPLMLPVNYMFAKWCHVPEFKKDLKAIIRDKQTYGGRVYLRGHSNIKSTFFSKLKYKILIKITKNPQKKKKYEKIYHNLFR